MKITIPCAAVFMILTSCSKMITGKQAAPVSTTSTTEGDIGCIYKVEIDAQFPGGESAWQRFVTKNLVYPAVAADIQGTVILQFVVDKEGSLYDIKAISGPEELRQSAIDVLKKSPKWVPSFLNGRHVKTIKKLAIEFKPEENNIPITILKPSPFLILFFNRYFVAVNLKPNNEPVYPICIIAFTC